MDPETQGTNFGGWSTLKRVFQQPQAIALIENWAESGSMSATAILRQQSLQVVEP
jgi:hypothetical protein